MYFMGHTGDRLKSRFENNKDVRY